MAKTLSEYANEAWNTYCDDATAKADDMITNRDLFKSGFYAAIALMHQITATAGREDEEKKRQSEPAGRI